MKKNIKKIIPMVAIATLMTTSVFANTNNNKETIAIEQTEAKENSIYINGNVLENANLIKENGKTLIPVRAIFEKLGYEIQYDANTKTVSMTKVPHFITFSSNADAYTFSRMAPQPLGQAPIVKEGVTYVPVSLFELIDMEVELTDNNVLYIGEKPNVEEKMLDEKVSTPNIKEQIIITEIDEDNNTITVEDDVKGTVVLNIKDLKIEYTTDVKQLHIGQALNVEYGDIMTRSNPPMNTPKSVKTVDKYSYGLIKNVDKDDKGNINILYDDNKIGEVVLNIPSDLKINFSTKDKELKEGQFIETVLGDAMTMSLPPMNTPKSLSVIEKDTQEENDAIMSNAVIKGVDKDSQTILITDEKLGDVVLNLHDELKIEYKNNTDTKEYDWMVKGQKLEVEYSPIMTRSLPPINNPIKILVLN